MIYKRAQAIVRKTIKAAKRKYWRNYCSNIGWDVQISGIWGMIRKMGGKHKTSRMPALRNGEVAITNEEKAEIFS